MGKEKSKIKFNSPVVLCFSLVCLVVLALQQWNPNLVNRYFHVYRAPLSDMATYFRLFSHVFGHMNWSHLFGNISLILVIGPLIEEKYGSADTAFVMLVTSLVTGFSFYFFFPGSSLCGASGIAFALILLASFSEFRKGEIPLTFIIVATLYLGKELYSGAVADDNISHMTHIIGGVIGAFFGFLLRKEKR